MIVLMQALADTERWKEKYNQAKQEIQYSQSSLARLEVQYNQIQYSQSSLARLEVKYNQIQYSQSSLARLEVKYNQIQ